MGAAERPDFTDVPDEAVEELYRSGEACLQGTIQFALAADQRATTLAGVFGGGSVALLAVAATIRTASAGDPAFMWASIATAAVLFVGALICAWAGRPIDFHAPGYEPKRLAKSASDPVWMKRYAAEDLQVRIETNRAALERGASHLKRGAAVAALAPLIGIAVYLALAFWP